MAALGAFLAALGVADAFRDTNTAGISSARRSAALAAGLLTLAALLAASGTPPLTMIGLGTALALLLAVWTLIDIIASVTSKTTARSAAFLAIATGTVVALLFADDGPSTWPGWIPGPLSTFAPSQLILVGGIAIAQVTTANVLVRLILEAVNVPTKEGSDRLRSGRVLGPMERLFILGLGLAGNLTAAAVVVGAKGLLRFPELAASESNVRAAASPIIIQTSAKNASGTEVEVDPPPTPPLHQGPNPVTEYFLIGSFASWLIALAGLGLAMLVSS
ncbi:hypothetical protein ACFQHV_01580 [Promicromonospora thailandica]|uniref:Uncharacterized protein n=1 Tax=Promicromonospora thailandica TaxID=765201 RepID=A0A9X2JWE3_9MICO|nr:hypothetical protein [Promicromonospora thailandica]MCP2265457.1 hypothetical protein [Promicromonospora thailandica]BFF17006.1 hypothetical protein GCM10025730_05270 [Promicromonospora thailandica]